jgi:putative sterol carrier protein
VATAFSDEWARAWCAALNASEAYRRTAATWEGSVALVAGDAAGRASSAIWLDLHHGSCRAAREAGSGDLETAEYVLEAEPSAWREVLEGRVSAVSALMTGRVRLTRGELGRLLPHAAAAQELLRLAARLDTEFPSTW